MQAVTGSSVETGERARTIFQQDLENIYRHTDKLFATLMVLQWIAGMVAALVISPRTWIGTSSQTHWHVWAAVFLGGAITSLPVYLARTQPGKALTRHTIAVAQMFFSALLIHLTGGRIETHFHVFGSLAFLAIYRDWRVLLTATVVISIDHFARGVWWPQSIFGILTPSPWRWIEHAGWVLFEDSFLVISTRQSLGELFEIATRRAKLELTNSLIEIQVNERTTELTAAHRELQKSEKLLWGAFEQAAIGMALVSPEGSWLTVNRALCDLFGYTAEELQEKTFQDLTCPEDLAADLTQMRQLLADEVQGYQMEKRYLHKDGRLVWVSLSVSLVRDPDGRPVHFISQLQNITERKEAESRLENAHNDLLAASRQAGMAEVATSVLHNVGNVLNSVNVSCSVVSDKVLKSRIGSVGKTADLLNRHAEDLAGFLTTDPTGRKLPAYLAKLAGQLASERAEVLRELLLLSKNIDHIKDIVTMQQSHAQGSGIVETVAVTELVEDSLRMNEGSMMRHTVRVIRDYQDSPVITTDRHKVMQILVNLARNAKNACDESGHAEKRITVRTTGTPDGGVKISIEDNGVGIPAENFTRIFNHGFTTRKTGHGFGLHHAALAAQELRGALTVHSAGPGLGAVFTLELPSTSLAAPVS